MSKQPLPFIPHVQTNESPLSVLRRAALGNGYHSLLSLLVSLNAVLDYSESGIATLVRSPLMFRAAATRIGIQKEGIDRVIYERVGCGREDNILWNRLEVPVGDLQFRRNKLCMACYVETGYTLSEWDHVSAFACAKHHIILDDACPICKQPWRYMHDPLSCGCPSEAITRSQRKCSPDSAEILASIIDTNDEPGLKRLTANRLILRWWQRLGISISPTVYTEAMIHLFTRRYYTPLAPKESTRLHPRPSVMPLLVSDNNEIQMHATALLNNNKSIESKSSLSSIRLPHSAAMAVLGIGRVPFNKLLEDGHLGDNDCHSIQITAINKLLLRVTEYVNNGADINPLNTCLKNLRRQSLSSFITSIQKNSDVNANNLATPRTYNAIVTGKTVLSIVDVCKQLHTNSESVRSAINTGLLKATRGLDGSAVKWAVDTEILQRFKEKYVFGSALAKKYNASPTTFSSRLRSAGLSPISGPGIDNGITYIFLREELKEFDLKFIMNSSYTSPAGRKRKTTIKIKPSAVSTAQLASILGIHVRKIKGIVNQGWISPVDPHTKSMQFPEKIAASLAKELRNNYHTLTEAAEKTGQTAAAFRKTWIDTQFIRRYKFTNTVLIADKDLQKILSLWQEIATGSAIGQQLGRHRWLCSNLKKMDLIEPRYTLGFDHKKVHLYARNDPALEHFKFTHN